MIVHVIFIRYYYYTKLSEILTVDEKSFSRLSVIVGLS